MGNRLAGIGRVALIPDSYHRAGQRAPFDVATLFTDEPLNRPEFRAYFLTWKDGTFMPVRYDQDTKAKAIRLVREHAGDYPSEYAAITAVAGRLGMSAETLRKWIRQAAVDEGQAPGVSSEAEKQIRELKRKVNELERTIEILTAATSFFAREHDPLRR